MSGSGYFDTYLPIFLTVKGFNFTVLKFRGFLNGDLSRGFNFADFEFLY